MSQNRETAPGEPTPEKLGHIVPALVATIPKIKIQTTRKSKDSAWVPEKLTTFQRARGAAIGLLSWVVIPLLVVLLIILTIWTHDPKLEDCQEGRMAPGSVNCPMFCPEPSRRCYRDPGMYVVPFLGIVVAWPQAFLLLYMLGLYLYHE